MKHPKARLFLCAAILALPLGSHAKTYAGFALCSPASPASLKSTIEGAGGEVVRVIDQPSPHEAIVIAKNYPVDVAPRNVSVTLYKGRIAYISIGNAGDLVAGLEAKYGSDFTTSTKEEKVGTTNSHHYKDSTDGSLELTISQFEIANNKGSFFSVNYACKDLYQQLEKSRQSQAATR